MSAQHTPGPWRLDEERDDYELSIVGKPTWPCNRFGIKGEWNVAKIDDLMEEYPGEAKANARLIAAAPDLLDSLESCVRFLNKHCPGADHLLPAAEAAIALATQEPAR